MTQFFARLVFDTNDGSVGLADSRVVDALTHSPQLSQKGMPFSELDLQELAAMNSHHDNL
ncbi:hypothetical protein ABIB15_000609 [Marisediminicola sp. UYEF4]|uniref:hypothetical protein n=1 Tax=Marisediminicola sp. UYEF4 TaxID=1756384 RepID=UPI00339A9FDF